MKQLTPVSPPSCLRQGYARQAGPDWAGEAQRRLPTGSFNGLHFKSKFLGTMCIGIIGVLMLSLPCTADEKGDFVKPPMKFRSRPLWFWNDPDATLRRLDKHEETVSGPRTPTDHPQQST